METFSKIYSGRNYIFALDMTFFDFAATYFISIPTVIDVLEKIEGKIIVSGPGIDRIVMLSALSASLAGYYVNYNIVRISEKLAAKIKGLLRK
jgi:hypothetical protein